MAAGPVLYRVAAHLVAEYGFDRVSQERSRFKQAILTLRGAAWQVAIGALGGAGGNMITG